jgi:uncharacterized membrane protein YhfC
MSVDPIVALSLALAALVCLIGPIALGVLWKQRTGVAAAPFGWGMAAFAGALVLRLWQFPLSRWVHKSHPASVTGFLLLSACTAGVFEEVGRWVGYRTVLQAERSQRVGVMYGLGHGACESILLVGGLPMLGLLVAAMLAAQGRIPAGSMTLALQQQIEALGAWGLPLAVLERASAMAIHVGLSLIVLQTFTRGGAGWLALAVVIHTAVDAAAALLNQHLLALHTELVVALLAVAILGAGVQMSRTAPPAVGHLATVSV